ncbi:MAG: MlaD family protein, partial [Nitriliruptorales bacterium]
MTPVVRRLLGTLAILLFVAGGKVLFDAVAAPPSGSIEVVAHLGRAGQGLDAGSDVKVRGVQVGTVKEVTLDDRANAVATLVIHPVHRLPKDVEALVVAKTLLGEKQIVLRPRGESLSEGPALADGDVLGVAGGGQPTEVQELVAALVPILDEIGPFDLAAIVDTFGSLDRQDAETAAENIELGA